MTPIQAIVGVADRRQLDDFPWTWRNHLSSQGPQRHIPALETIVLEAAVAPSVQDREVALLRRHVDPVGRHRFLRAKQQHVGATDD